MPLTHIKEAMQGLDGKQILLSLIDNPKAWIARLDAMSDAQDQGLPAPRFDDETKWGKNPDGFDDFMQVIAMNNEQELIAA